MFGNSPGFILIFAIIASHFNCNVRSQQLNDIIAASADFLEKAFLDEVDFDSPDAFSVEWVGKAEEVMRKYVQKIKEVHRVDHHAVGKRETDDQLTITRDFQGVNALTRIEDLYDTTAQYPYDITLFYLPNDQGVRELFAAVLQSVDKDPELERANMMTVFKLEGDKFKLLDQTPVMGGADIESFNINGIPYIVAAEFDAGSRGMDLEGSVVYRLVDKKLENVQTLNTKYPSDVVIWEDLNEVYMAVATSQGNHSMHNNYEADSLVYRWLGEHFDLITTIKTYNARCVTPFKIGSTMYLAVANHMNNNGETDIDSEIFKYNLNDDRFVSHQKIRTHGVMDIKFFSSANKRKREHFIVVANSFEIGLDGNKIYETGSIIYKYADDYFVPFQSIKLNAAIQWLPVSGPRGDLVLLAACSSGIQTFQYDGWRFVKTEVQYSIASLGPGISSMRSFMFGGGLVLAIANRNKQGGDADIFNLKFKPTYDLQEFHLDLHEWCTVMVNKVDADDLNELMRIIELAPKEDDETIHIAGDLIIEDAVVQNVETKEMNIGDDILMNKDVILELNNYTSSMNDLLRELKNLEATVENSMRVSGENHIQGSLKFENITMICTDCKFADAHIKTLNDENVDRFLHNIVYLTDGLVSNGTMEFESVTVESFQDGMQYFNGKPITAVVARSSDALFSGTMQLEGTATLLGGLSVDGNIDGLFFSPQTILLTDQDQSLDGSISLGGVSVNNLDLEILNDMNASLLFYGTVKINGQHDIYMPTILKNARVGNMKVDGPYNGLNLESLVNSTLKVCGVQTVYGQWNFEKLNCETFALDGPISGFDLGKDFVKTDGFQYEINGELEFLEPVTVERLYISSDFNGISIVNGVPDVLLLHPIEPMNITGKKEIETLYVKSQLTVSGRFNGLHMEESNTVKTIQRPITLNGDAIVHGKLSINGNLKTGDVKDSSGRYSLQKVLAHGIKSENTVFSGKSITVKGNIEVDNVLAGKINGIRTESWVKQNGKQTISVMKNFGDGVQVLQPVVLTGLVNGVDLLALDEDVLKTTGNQTIYGVKKFKAIKAPSFVTYECLFEDQWCNNLVITSETQNMKGTNVFHGSAKVLKQLSVVNLTVDGSVGGYDLDFLIRDTLFTSVHDAEVKAPKTFKGPLSFDNLEVSGKVGVLDMKNLLTLLYEKQFTNYEGATIISQPTTIKNFQFTGWLNGISHEELGSSWLLHSGEQKITGDNIFLSVIANQNAVLLSGQLNGWNLEESTKNIATINKNAYLDSVRIDKVTAEGPVYVEGLLQGLNVSTDIIYANSEEEIKINAKKVFKSNLKIEGELRVDGMDQHVNYGKLCELFMSTESSPLELTVEGNVEMEFEPVVEEVNGKNLEDIHANVWMADRDTVLNGFKDFIVMIFNGDVSVKGLVDGVDIKTLPERCLSKTKDQVIKGMVSFPGGLLFEKTLTVQNAHVGGLVSGLILEDFVSRVLLSDSDQSFTGTPTFEEIATEGHLDVEAVNGMKLDEDVMRWDKELNVIKGKLEVKNLFAKELRLGEDAKVQGIDIPLWSKLAVRSLGIDENSTQTIRGTKTMVDAEFIGDLWVEGKVDQIMFDAEHIMLLSEEQTVKGKKSFACKGSLIDKKSLFVKQLETEGLLNDVDISDFFSRLLHKNEDITFTVQKTFTHPMMAENVITEGLYHGVNISGIDLAEVSIAYQQVISKLDGFYSTSSDILRESLMRRATYVDHYQSVQGFDIGGLVLPISFADSSEPLLAFINKENTTYSSLEIYKWSSDSNVLKKGEVGIDLENLSFAGSVLCANSYYLYIEFSDSESQPLKENTEDRGLFVSGAFLEFTPENGFMKSNSIETRGTTSAVPVLVPLLNSCCFFMAQWNGPNSMILCKRVSLDQMFIFQRIPAFRIIEASSGLIEGLPYVAYVVDPDVPHEKGSSNVCIWLYSNQTQHFEPLQDMVIEGAQSVASIEYHGISYLAVTAGSVPNAIQTGMIKIFRLDSESLAFVSWINLDVALPWAVKFSILPSDELVLYVSTENLVKPLIVYLYEGLAGFRELTYAAHAPTHSQFSIFSLAGSWNNFVVVSGVGGRRMFKPVFKGV